MRLYPLIGKARGVNPEDNREPNSLKLSGADSGILLETYWHSSFLGVYQHCGEGGSAVWATAYYPTLAMPVPLKGTIQAQVRDLTRSTGADDEHITVLLCYNYQDNYQLINLIKVASIDLKSSTQNVKKETKHYAFIQND